MGCTPWFKPIISDSEWFPQDISGSDKIHLWARVTPGSHNIYHTDPSVTFLALVSGTFKVNSYAYAAGLRLAQINAVSCLHLLLLLLVNEAASPQLVQTTIDWWITN